jgi:hypothetical protein
MGAQKGFEYSSGVIGFDHFIQYCKTPLEHVDCVEIQIKQKKGTHHTTTTIEKWKKTLKLAQEINFCQTN